jgi:hypothetical protein
MQADERSTLVSFLRWYRQTFELKCSGLEPVDLARRAVEPSSMALLGLIRHLAEVERSWFRRRMAGEDASPLFSSDSDDPDFDGAVPDPVVVAEAWDLWRAEVANAERFVSEAPSLDVAGTDPWRGPVSLRWVPRRPVTSCATQKGFAASLSSSRCQVPHQR